MSREIRIPILILAPCANLTVTAVGEQQERTLITSDRVRAEHEEGNAEQTT